MPTPHGRFVWYELLTSDPQAAQRFYGEVAGWGTQKWNGPAPYTMWTNDGTPLGGVMAMPENIRAMRVPPNWLPYVGVRDVNATARDVTRLGGTVLHEPEDIPGMGRFAVIRDPQGAVLAVYTSAADDASTPSGPPRRGEFSWHELMTTDYAAAFDFYSTLFDWEAMSDFDMGPMGIYRLYGQNGQQYGGMFNKPPDAPFPPNWLCYIQVDDVRRAVDTITRLGGTVMNGPMEVPGGDWIAQCMDPQGAAFAVHQKKS